MDVREYLARIGLPEGMPPTLAELHERHLLSVPFETLDIHRGVPIVLDEAALLEKIVGRRRGGFCYELNGAFAWLLRACGFRVQYLAADVATPQGHYKDVPFDHMTLRVDLERAWLVDVGFGNGPLYPVPLDGEEVQQVGERCAVRVVGDWHVLVRDAQPLYRFKLRPFGLRDFDPGCHYHQTSPDSPFAKKRLCSITKPAGRLTLTDDVLIELRKGERTETPVDDFDAALARHFGITTATA